MKMSSSARDVAAWRRFGTLRAFGGMSLTVGSESVRMAGQNNLQTDLDARDMPIYRPISAFEPMLNATFVKGVLRRTRLVALKAHPLGTILLSARFDHPRKRTHRIPSLVTLGVSLILHVCSGDRRERRCRCPATRPCRRPRPPGVLAQLRAPQPPSRSTPRAVMLLCPHASERHSGTRLSLPVASRP